MSSGGLAWIVFGALCVLVAALGVIGFTRYQEGLAVTEPLASRFYRSLQLFVLESGSVAGAVPWQLNAARFAAPLLAAYAIVAAVVVVFREQITGMRLRTARRHVLVAGAGTKGSRLAEAVLASGGRVVALEADRDNEHLDSLRAGGALVVIGDARDARTLGRAGVERARRLVVLCGDDGVNAQVVAAARSLLRRQHAQPPVCVAHISDPDLSVLLCVDEFDRYGSEQMRVEFVNLTAVAVQALLRAHPPVTKDHLVPPRVLVVGDGTTAQQLMCALGRAWALMSGHNESERLQLTWVADTSAVAQAWLALHPEIDKCSDLSLVPDLESALRGQAVGVAYVCPDDDSVATELAIRLRTLAGEQAPRIVAVLTTVGGLGTLLARSANCPGEEAVVTFGLLDKSCQPDILLFGTTELLAQAIHRTYVEAHSSDPHRQADPALRPWDELSESLRESNRDHAAHVAVKLRAVGLTLGPLTNWATALQPFSDHQIETMARLEHGRWVAERQAAGWRPGVRNLEARTSPHLIPWEELSEEVRDEDRAFICKLPQLLASVGLQILRPSDIVAARRGQEVLETHERMHPHDSNDFGTGADHAKAGQDGS